MEQQVGWVCQGCYLPNGHNSLHPPVGNFVEVKDQIYRLYSIDALNIYICFRIGFENRKKMWNYVRNKLCPMSQNQVASLAIINVQENNFVANAATQSDTSELLSVATMTVSIIAYMINIAAVSKLNVRDTIEYRNMLNLAMMAITHTVWIFISQKLRQFAVQVITDIRGWISI